MMAVLAWVAIGDVQAQTMTQAERRARVDSVHNFSPRSFFGATLVMNNSVFVDNVVVVNQNKWRARAFFGLRL